MPYADPEHARAYFREYRRMRRGGDDCSTRLPAEFRLETAGDVIALIENQVQAVLDEAAAGTLEKARCIGFLASVSLKAIEYGTPGSRGSGAGGGGAFGAGAGAGALPWRTAGRAGAGSVGAGGERGRDADADSAGAVPASSSCLDCRSVNGPCLP